MIFCSSGYAYIVYFSSLFFKLFISFVMPLLSSRVVPTNVDPFSISQIAIEADVKYLSKDMLQPEKKVYSHTPFTRYLVYSSVSLTQYFDDS